MPLDTRIALGGQPLQLESPLAQYGQLMNVVNAGTQNQLAQMQMQENQQMAPLRMQEMQSRAAANKLTYDQAKEAQDFIAGVMSKAAEHPEAPRDPMEAAQQMLMHPNAQVQAVGTRLLDASQKINEYKQQQQYLKDQGTPPVNALAPSSAAPVNALAAKTATDIMAQITKGDVQYGKAPGWQAQRALLVDQYKEAVKTPVFHTVAEGAALIGPDGKPVYTAPAKTPTPSELTRLIAERDAAKTKGATPDIIASYDAAIKKAATHQPPTQISLTQNAEKSYGTAFGGKIADLDVAKYDAATKAPELAANANRVLASLNDGNVFVGPAATVKLNLARVLNAAGASNDEKIANTETLISNLGRNTLGMVKSSGLGTGQGFTDKDLQFLEKVAGGSIDYNAQTLRNLAELSHKAAEASASTWNKRTKEIPASAIAGTGISTEAITVPARAAKAAAATRPAGVPAEWVLHTDATGKKAYVSPDGKSFKEVP
jgi:hypothetical protein